MEASAGQDLTVIVQTQSTAWRWNIGITQVRGMLQSGQGYAAVRAGVCCRPVRGMLKSGQGYAAIRPGVWCSQVRGMMRASRGKSCSFISFVIQ